MLQIKTQLLSWGIGLSEDQAKILGALLGKEHSIELFEADNAPDLDLLESANPFLVWVTPAFCKRLLAMDFDRKRHYDAIPKVLLLGETYSIEDFEVACDCGITDISRGPLTKERMADIMRRALEAQSIHYDVQCMTREITLERELLERKNELLGFLVNFLTNTTESLDIEYILQTAFSGLGKLLPVKSIHAAFWEPEDECSNLSMYLCAQEDSPAHALWRSALLEQANRMTGRNFSIEEATTLQLPEQEKEWVSRSPDDGFILTLPVISRHEQLGVVMLVTSMERHLGRDQAMALDSAMRHFALSIKNSRRFRLIQTYADYDALTKVHSRRHFEGRLEEEMQRFTRYGQGLSLIMLDIDHFKQINDNLGHHVGDIVLREVAALIADGIRTSDYCARYGGEEFVILLPHTNCRNALRWAERMRKRISGHIFMQGDKSVELTVSMGISSLAPGQPKHKQALLCEADAALYSSKQNGRNCCGYAGALDEAGEAMAS